MSAIFRSSRKERLSFAMFMAGQALFNQFLGSFGQVFMTDRGISAAVVGTIFLVTRIFDAANDPMFGGIVDRSNLKGGKFIPWLRLGVLLLPLLTSLLYLLPSSLPMRGKIIWASFFYVFYSISYTICDVPIYSMVSATSDQLQERVQIQSNNSVASALAMLVMMVVVPLLYPKIGWTLTAVVLILPAVMLMLPMTRNAKERYVDQGAEPVTLKSMGHFLQSNRYLLLFFSGVLVLNATSTVANSGVYFATHNLGNTELTGLISAIFAAPALVFAVALPQLTKRFDKFQIFLVCVIGQFAISILSIAVGYDNMIAMFAVLAVRGLFWGGNSLMMLMFTSDFIEYGQFKTGKRLQGTANSIQTFVCKLMTAINGAVTMFVLSAVGFASGAGAVQSATVHTAIWMLFSVIPGVGALLSLPIFWKYNLRDKDVQLMARANTGEITRQEAEIAFSHSYER